MSGQPKKNLACCRHPVEACFEPFGPFRSRGFGRRIGLGEIIRTILGEPLNEEGRLRPILERLQALGASAASIGNDELLWIAKRSGRGICTRTPLR